LPFAAWLAACGGAPTPAPGGVLPGPAAGDLGQSPQSGCTPGQQIDCACPGSSLKGTQVCRESGVGFDRCTGCPEDGGVAADSGTVGGSPCGDCAGCCAGTTCVPFATQTNASCGATGTSCAACSSNQTCLSGACIANTGACDATCKGCCKNNLCVPYNATNCGDKGGTCSTCMPGALCNGTCTTSIDPNLYFQIIVTSLQVQSTKANGDVWDAVAVGSFTEPDPFVCFEYTDAGVAKSGCIKNSCQDFTSCVYSAADGLVQSYDPNTGTYSPVYFKGAAIKSGAITIKVLDDDGYYPMGYDSNDLIGMGPLPGRDQLMSSYGTGAFNQVTNVVYSIK
jgi:hypothetical protein